MKKVGAVAEVYKGDVNPSDWVVQSLDPSGDGTIFRTIFSGPYAEQRALEYAEAKYAGFRRRDPDQSEYQSIRSSDAHVGRLSSRGANLRLVK